MIRSDSHKSLRIFQIENNFILVHIILFLCALTRYVKPVCNYITERYCNNYIDQFTEAMCSKKIKVCMDFVYVMWERRSQLLSTSMLMLNLLPNCHIISNFYWLTSPKGVGILYKLYK